MSVTRVEGPFEYYDVTGDQIEAAAESPRSQVAIIADIADDLALDEQGVVGSTEGDITLGTSLNPQVARQTAAALAANGEYACGCIKLFAEAVDAFDTKVAELNQRYRTDLASAMRYQGQANAQLPEDEQRSSAEVGAGIEAYLKTDYAAALEELDTQADNVAQMLGDGPTDQNVRKLFAAGQIPIAAAERMFPGIEFTDQERLQAEQAQFLETIEDMDPAEQADYIREHVQDAPPDLVDHIPPETAEKLADYTADDLTSDDARDVDADTVALLALLNTSAAYNSKLFSRVSPNQIADTVRSLSDRIYSAGGTQRSANDPDFVADNEMYDGLLDELGESFANYTKQTGADEPPADLVDRWYGAITDTTRNPENAAALTMLIRHGGEQTSFDDRFLGDLTSKVYEWERNQGGDPVWGPANEALGDGYYIRDPQLSGEGADRTAVGMSGFDGLANLLGGMENTPGAAERFFSDGGTTTFDSPKDGVDDVEVNDRLHYLLMQREWPTDDGDGFGEALAGATTHSRNDGPSGQAAAQLAGQSAFMIGQSVGENESFWNVDGTDGWQIPTGMRDSVGEMMASYIPDVNRAANTNGEGDPASLGFIHAVDGKPTGMALSGDDLDAILNSLGEGDDKTGLQYVAAAAYAHHDQQIGQAMDSAVMPDGSKPRTVADLENALIPDGHGGTRSFQEVFGSESSFGGNTMATILEQGFKGGKADEAIDQAGREALGKAFGAATSFIPTPANAIAGTITSEGLSYLGDQLSNQPDSVTDAWAEDADSQLAHSLRFSTYDHLLRNDLISVGGPGGLPEDAVITDPDGTRRVDPALYASDSDSGVDPQVQAQFNQWVIEHGSSVYGQTQIDAYRSNFPQFGSD